MGSTLREIIFDIGGGLKGGAAFKGVQIGGPSGGCLVEEHLDVPLDFDQVKKYNAIIGSGGLVVMDGIEPTLQESESCVLSVRLRLLNWLIDSTENIITHNLKKIKTFFVKSEIFYDYFINFSENA